MECASRSCLPQTNRACVKSSKDANRLARKKKTPSFRFRSPTENNNPAGRSYPRAPVALRRDLSEAWASCIRCRIIRVSGLLEPTADAVLVFPQWLSPRRPPLTHQAREPRRLPPRLAPQEVVLLLPSSRVEGDRARASSRRARIIQLSAIDVGDLVTPREKQKREERTGPVDHQ